MADAGAAIQGVGLAFNDSADASDHLEQSADQDRRRPQRLPHPYAGRRALGRPVQIARRRTESDFNEVYTSLQTKVVDGYENPYAIINTSRLYEVQKYLSVTNHPRVCRRF
jgi:hypothetical protein